MSLFNSNTEFVNYIFSLKWRETDPNKIECWPQGKYSLSDLINHIETLSNGGLMALHSDIIFKAEAIKFQELSDIYPQEIFIDLYEVELDTSNLEKLIEQKYPVANYVLQNIEERLKHHYEQNNSEQQQADSTEPLRLPDNLNTERAIKYFARAVEAGLMEPTPTGYNWLFYRGSLVSLGYFVEKVYCPNAIGKLPEQAINRLFNVNRIGSAITQLHNAKKNQKWRANIDVLFDD